MLYIVYTHVLYVENFGMGSVSEALQIIIVILTKIGIITYL